MKKINEIHDILTYSADALSLIEMVRKGINYSSYLPIFEKSSINIQEWAHILQVSERTIQRHKKENISFKPLQSEKILQIAFLIDKGQEVFGDNTKFSQWLGAECLALGGNKPKELLDNFFGIQLIENELEKIQHGIFA